MLCAHAMLVDVAIDAAGQCGTADAAPFVKPFARVANVTGGPAHEGEYAILKTSYFSRHAEASRRLADGQHAIFSMAEHVHSLSSLCSTLSLLPASRQRLLHVRKPKLYGNYLDLPLPCILLPTYFDSFLLPPSDVNLSSTDSLPSVSESARGMTNCLKHLR